MPGHYPQDFIESVRDAADIVRVVSEYVPLKQAGRRMKGLCPFHQEKTPSFSVDPSSNLFYCFGCQTGGDVFKFVSTYEKLNFVETIEMLAQRFGVPLPAKDERAAKADDLQARVRQMNAAAEKFYSELLRDPAVGSRCRDYLERRGLSDETVRALGLGFAPDSWEALSLHLAGKRYRPEELQQAGLVLPRKQGNGHYDRFRDRLIFPIRDVNGRPVAFGGRILGDGQPKYMNSPETPAYTKGDHLYGLDRAREPIRREGFAIVVEGYLDYAAVMQAGFENVVASLGTAFTANQSRLLSRFTKRIVVSYDGDAAGAAATIKSLDLMLERGFEVRVVDLPTGDDPDDYINRDGAAAYGRLVRAAPDYLQFIVDTEARRRDLSRVEEKVAAVNAVLPHLARLKSRIERAEWAGRLADALAIDDELVLQELQGALRSARTTIRQKPAQAIPLRDAEARMISLLLRCEAGERTEWLALIHDEDLEGSCVRSLVGSIRRLSGEGVTVDYPSVLEALEDEADRDLLTRIAFRDEPEKGPSFEDCLCAFSRARLRRDQRQVAHEIGKLQEDTTDSSATDLNQRLMELQRIAQQRDALH